MKLKLSITFLLFILVSACNDDSSQSTASKPESNNTDEDIATLEPYLDEQVFETHSNGEHKIGLYSETNGQGTFEDCKTGKTYIIDINKDASLLHSSYSPLTKANGQKLLVEIIGETLMNKEDLETIRPEILLSIIHKETCNNKN
ncbi:hypothetical protein [Kangiella aquimarina]|uniref:NlpE C-terminal OB domain-containing protein n=1 Tax=Kangiella aquimarina TaxID=261965 RepID=A0ABZ0X7U0_9GAMM|nr:hypothetical protein [Kangiella aquimarina]WQG86456.1 hypothetical protein SR900_06080 [Kangiella aquimarina]